METFSALLAICAGNSPVTGEFPSQRPVTRSFDDFFNLRLNKRLSKQSRRRWFETPSRSLWRYFNENFLETGDPFRYTKRRFIVRSLEAAGQVLQIILWLWNLAGASVALLPRDLSYFRAMGQSKPQTPPLQIFVRYCEMSDIEASPCYLVKRWLLTNLYMNTPYDL